MYIRKLFISAPACHPCCSCLQVRLSHPGSAAPAVGAKDPLAITLPLAAGEAGGFSISEPCSGSLMSFRVLDAAQTSDELVAFALVKSVSASAVRKLVPVFGHSCGMCMPSDH